MAERIEPLRELVPEALSEGKVDFEKLRAALGYLVDERLEPYSFTWGGKGDAVRLLQTPSRATLVPCPEESVNFDTTQYLFIEGDNLEVLKLLYKSYAGRLKMIYIDPPCNTGNDFIYADNFADSLDTYLHSTDQTDEAGNLLTSNPETSGRYHSAWLSMMYPRLFVSRRLLREAGAIFISIDDHEAFHKRVSETQFVRAPNAISEEWSICFDGWRLTSVKAAQRPVLPLRDPFRRLSVDGSSVASPCRCTTSGLTAQQSEASADISSRSVFAGWLAQLQARTVESAGTSRKHGGILGDHDTANNNMYTSV